MKYLILNKCTDKLLLSAMYNPDNDYYLSVSNVIEKEELDKQHDDHYILQNIHTKEPTELLDGILWDENNLSIDDVEKLNTYLEIDKPAYLGNLYCEELEQLLEYDPFMGNISCPIPDTKEKVGKCAYLARHDEIFFADYIAEIKKLGYDRILTLGDFQKLVSPQDILTYKPTKDLKTDVANIARILYSGNIAFYPIINYSTPTEYESELVSEVLKEIKFDEKISLLTYYGFMFTNFTFDFKDYDYLIMADRLPRSTFCNQTEQLHSNSKDDFMSQIKTFSWYKELKSKIVNVENLIGDEYVEEESDSYIFSKKYRDNNGNKNS